MPHFARPTFLILIASPAIAAAQPAAESPPRAMTKLLECRSITDAAARLVCFDREVAAFDTAVATREVVVADREEVRSARRKLFGLTLPSISLFGRDDDARSEILSIEAKIVSASQGRDGKWRLELDDESRWAQTDTETPKRTPKPGMDIRIRRGAVGSYLANIGGATAIRVARVN
jgi:hypothetical protein